MLTLAHLQQRRSRRWLFGLTLLLLVTLLISLCAGEQWIPPGEWLSAKGQLFIWQIRLPRTLAVLLVGAALALSGAIMQALFENPLAEPGLLGVSNGAGVGLIAAVLLGKGVLPGWALGLCAIFGALLITFILLRFARRHLSTSRLLLAGVPREKLVCRQDELAAIEQLHCKDLESVYLLHDMSSYSRSVTAMEKIRKVLEGAL